MQTALFKALSDPTRLRCVILLAQHAELCVCDLTGALALPQPKISHHLGNLRRAGLVSDRRQGLWHFYRLHPDLPDWARRVIEQARDGLAAHEPFALDADRLANDCSDSCCA
jgi:ArsR family transcriptional regulator